jgi:hypothetical protein
MPYSTSTACLVESLTFRTELVWKLDEQSTFFVSPLEYAPGEQRRSGFGPAVQLPVRVRGASRTVDPTLTWPVLPADAAPASQTATPP